MVPSWADQLLPQLLMDQFDTLPIQCRHIEHMHEGVWFKKIIFDKMTSMRIQTIFPTLSFQVWIILCIWSYQMFQIASFKIICTDSTEILFTKLRSAGLNCHLSKLKFFTFPYLGGGGGGWYLINIAYWPFFIVPGQVNRNVLTCHKWNEIRSDKQGNVFPHPGL